MKVYREIDNRNNFYGRYKYQLRISNFVRFDGYNKFISTQEIKSWLAETFGSEYTYDRSSTSFCRDRNTSWTTHKRSGGSIPFLYLKGDEELGLFLMRWS